MKHVVEGFISTVFFILWMVGIVLAAGWLKVVAIMFPPYALYLCAEKWMQLVGLI